MKDGVVDMQQNPSTRIFQDRRRLDIDVLRFYAIALVTSFHLARWLGYDKLTFLNPFKLVFVEGAGIGVYTFFAISGYCLAMRYDDSMSYGKFLGSRLLRIIPTYYVAIAIWCVFVSAGISYASIGLKDVLLHMAFVHVLFPDTFFSVCGVFWFLGVIMQLYLLFPLFFRICRGGWIRGVALAVVPFGIAICMVKICGVTYPGFAKSSLMYMTPFVAGMLFCMYPVKLKWRVVKFVLLALSVALFFMKIPYVYGEVARQAKTILFVFGVLQFENEIARLPQGIATLVKMIAASSFSIYLYNYVFYAGRPGSRNGWVLLCCLGMVFGFGMIMHNLVERPLNDLVKKLQARLK